jgi:hypothetical protein
VSECARASIDRGKGEKVMRGSRGGGREHGERDTRVEIPELNAIDTVVQGAVYGQPILFSLV